MDETFLGEQGMKITKEQALTLDLAVHAKMLEALAESERTGEPIILACMPANEASLFDDDLFTNCVGCDIQLRHRPYVPQKVTKLCLSCATKMRQTETMH